MTSSNLISLILKNKKSEKKKQLKKMSKARLIPSGIILFIFFSLCHFCFKYVIFFFTIIENFKDSVGSSRM